MVIFDEIKPTKIIKKIRPNVVVRGDDYSATVVKRRDNIHSKIKIKIFPKKSGHSTTQIINKINAINKKK